MSSIMARDRLRRDICGEILAHGRGDDVVLDAVHDQQAVGTLAGFAEVVDVALVKGNKGRKVERELERSLLAAVECWFCRARNGACEKCLCELC